MSLANELIDRETGEIDYFNVLRYAHQRAVSVWLTADYPSNLKRSCKMFAMDRARDLQMEWRRDHGLPGN